MARKGQNQSKRKGLVVSTINQQSKSLPRTRVRGNLSENSTLLIGNQYLTAPEVTTTNTLGYGKLALTPGNAAGFSTYPVETIASRYQNGLYLPGTKLEYIPAVGLNIRGTIAVAYIDSPNLMKQWGAVTPGNHLAFIQGLTNVKTGPLWQSLTFPLPPNTRRKDYMIDPALVTSDTNELDLAAQGFYLWIAYGLEPPAANLTVGQMILHTRMRVRELIGFTQT